MKITLPTKWSRLGEWQLEEISYLYFTAKPYHFQDTFVAMLHILLRGRKGIFGKIRLWRITSQVPLSALVPYGEFLYGHPQVHTFPEIKGLSAPTDRLADMKMQQYSYADTLYHHWRTQGNELYLRQLVASLYTFGGNFDPLKLPEVAERTDRIPLKKMYRIGLAYMSVRQYIVKQYPHVFPEREEKETDTPVFRNTQYVPMGKIITAMAMDERQPLGTLAECYATPVRDFFFVLEENILRNNNERKQISKYAK